MDLKGITTGYPIRYTRKETKKIISEQHYDNIITSVEKNNIQKCSNTKQLSAAAIYEKMKKVDTNKQIEKSEKETKQDIDKEDSESKTDIIVKPDGSRVLVVTMNIGGMETTMSLEISKPTAIQNDSANQTIDNNNILTLETNTISNEMLHNEV